MKKIDRERRVFLEGSIKMDDRKTQSLEEVFQEVRQLPERDQNLIKDVIAVILDYITETARS